MKRKILFYSAGIVFLFLFAGWLSLSTPHNPKRSDTSSTKGKLVRIRPDTATGDIGFDLENSDGITYYINRGLQQHLPVAAYRKQLVNNEVTILYYDNGFPPFSSLNKLWHICEVQIGDSVIYTEL